MKNGILAIVVLAAGVVAQHQNIDTATPQAPLRFLWPPQRSGFDNVSHSLSCTDVSQQMIKHPAVAVRLEHAKIFPWQVVLWPLSTVKIPSMLKSPSHINQVLSSLKKPNSEIPVPTISRIFCLKMTTSMLVIPVMLASVSRTELPLVVLQLSKLNTNRGLKMRLIILYCRRKKRMC